MKYIFLCCSDKPQKLLLRSALAKLFNHNPLFSLSLEQNFPQSEKKNNSKQIFCIRQSENRIREMFNVDNSFHLILQFHVVVHKLSTHFAKQKPAPKENFSWFLIVYAFMQKRWKKEMLFVYFWIAFLVEQHRVLILPFFSVSMLFAKKWKLFYLLLLRKGDGNLVFVDLLRAFYPFPTVSLFFIMKILEIQQCCANVYLKLNRIDS